MIDKGDFIDNFNDECVSFIDNDNKDKDFINFNSSFENEKIDFNNNFSDITVSLFVNIENNINVYIVEVPNETAPSIQGFAKPPA